MSKSWSKALAGIFRISPGEHLHVLQQDFVYTLRLMIKNPGFTAVTLLTLALGVGVNTAVFSLIHGIILRPLPYSNPDEIVIVRQQIQKANLNLNFSVPEIEDYRHQNETLSSLVEYHTMTYTMLGQDTADRVKTGVVSWNFFDFFGVKPILGRSFLPAEERPGAPPVIVLSYEYWQRNQHGDPDIVGKSFAMNDKAHTVIGVLPPVPQYPSDNDVYMTTTSCPLRSSAHYINNRDMRMMSLFGRIKPGILLSQANSDLALIASRLGRQYPESYNPPSSYRANAVLLKDELTRRVRPTLYVLLGAAGFVLLIACANVANFTLARMSQREQEIMVRTALGAGRGRLLRQLFTESLVVGLFSAALGLLLAIVSRSLLVQFVSRLTPLSGEISIDRSVLLFALGAAVLTSVIAGSSTAFLSREQMASGLNESSWRSTTGTKPKRVRNSLIVAQVAFALILLIGSGLLLRSFVKLQKVDLGFVPEKVLTMAVDLNWSKYNDPDKTRMAIHTIIDKVQSLPGVVSAAVSSSFPLDPDSVVLGKAFEESFEIEGQPIREGEARPISTIRLVSQGYFKTLGIPLIQGRLFQATDTMATLKVVLISQSVAQHRFPDQNPVGKRISGDMGMSWVTIVGVVGSTKEFNLNEEPVDEIYAAMEQSPRFGSLLVRTAEDPETLIPTVRRTMRDFDPDTAIANVETLEAARHDTLSSPRLMADLLGIFAGLALVIAASGIGGMIALTVSQRIKEIGIRMALGAQPGDVLKMIIKQGMVLVVIGLACGFAISLAVTQPLKLFLFKVAPTDPLTAVSVCVLLGITALIACYIPARRATRVDPLLALRHE